MNRPTFRQAIVCRYHGPTNTRGARVSARAQAGRLTLAWDDALDPAGNFARVARAFAGDKGWPGTMAGGFLPDGSCVFVFTDGAEVRR